MRYPAAALLAAALIATPLIVSRPAGAAPQATEHEVKMLLDGTEGRFDPEHITIKRGDRIRFVTVSGGPHNVAFDPEKVPAAARAPLSAGMPDQIAPLSGPLVLNTGDSYTVSFAGVPAGTYEYTCLPHVAMGMNAKITVQ